VGSARDIATLFAALASTLPTQVVRFRGVADPNALHYGNNLDVLRQAHEGRDTHLLCHFMPKMKPSSNILQSEGIHWCVWVATSAPVPRVREMDGSDADWEGPNLGSSAW
jgi:hypothetical protein